jgi:PAS domain S-box-containing protein
VDGELSVAIAESGAIDEAVVSAFERLAQGDFSVRLPLTGDRAADAIAARVNAAADSLEIRMRQKEHALVELETAHAAVEEKVTELSDTLISIAGGDFNARAARSNKGDSLDVLTHMVNSTAGELELLFADRERERESQRAILESMVEGVILLGPAYEIQQANPAIARMLGFAAVDELVGRPMRSLLVEAHLGSVCNALAELTPVRPLHGFDVVMTAKDGALVPLVLSASVHHERGLTGVVLVVRDERELRAARTQLQIADRMAVIGTVAAGVAHEINNPLMYVQSNIEYVAEELSSNPDLDLPSDVLRALEDSLGGAHRIRDIVRELKVFSRGDDERLSHVDVNAVMDSTLEMLRNELRHRARVVRDYGELSSVIANAGRLGQVFLNLVHNAVQAIPEGDAEQNEIRLRTRMERAHVVIQVTDSGAGIPPEVLPRIFDAFFTTKPTGIGTGLGLSICQKVVTGAGGTIRVESEPGRGTTFTVTLPAAEDDAPASRPSARRPTASKTKRGRILIVDDEPDIARALYRLLAPEHDVVSFVDATAALTHMTRETFDVVLCDVMMPRMSGMALYRRVLDANPAQAKRFVFMTGGTFTPESRSFIDAVERPRLEKPFQHSEVTAIIESTIATATTTEQRQLPQSGQPG